MNSKNLSYRQIASAKRGEIPRAKLEETANQMGIKLSQLYRRVKHYKEIRDDWQPNWKDKPWRKDVIALDYNYAETISKCKSTNENAIVVSYYLTPKKLSHVHMSLSQFISIFRSLENDYPNIPPDKSFARKYGIKGSEVKAIRAFNVVALARYSSNRIRNREILLFVKYAIYRVQLEKKLPSHLRRTNKISFRKEIECIAEAFGLSWSFIYRLIGNIKLLKEEIQFDKFKTFTILNRSQHSIYADDGYILN